MKRKIAMLLALIMALVMLAACGENAADKSAQDDGDDASSLDQSGEEEYTLTVWYWGEQDVPGMKDYMEKAVDMYMERYPKINVEAVLQESDNMQIAFRTAESAGEGPDVQFLWAGALALEDVWLGNIEPLDNWVSPELLDSIEDEALAETTWDGKHWAMPWFNGTYAWVYNKEMFSQAGLDPDSPPETWDDFLNACEALKDAGFTPIGAGTKDGFLQGWLTIFMAQQNLDSANDMIAVCKGEASYTDKKYSEWLYLVEELLQKGYFNDDILSLDLYQGQQLFEAEKAAITMLCQPYAAKVERAMGSDVVQFMKYPIYGEGKLNITVGNPSQTLAIPKSAKHKEGAAQFLEFLNEPEQIKLKYELANAFTPSKSFDMSWLNDDIDTDRLSLQWNEQDGRFTYQNIYPPAFEYEGLVPVIQKMFAEGLSAEDAAAELDDALKKWRTENPDQLEAYSIWEYAD